MENFLQQPKLFIPKSKLVIPKSCLNLVKNQTFCQKSKILSKIENFIKNWKFYQKLKIFIKNRIFCQNFYSKYEKSNSLLNIQNLIIMLTIFSIEKFLSLNASSLLSTNNLKYSTEIADIECFVKCVGKFSVI